MAILDILSSDIFDKQDNAPHQVSFLRGRGDGTFDTARSYRSHLPPAAAFIDIGDFNDDQALDVAFALLGRSFNIDTSDVGDSFGLMLGNGDGTFAGDRAIPTESPRQIVVGDFNNDDLLDVASLFSYIHSATLYIYLADAEGYPTLSHQIPFEDNGVFGLVEMRSGDTNGDGDLDLIMLDNNAGTVALLTGHGDGTFADRLDFDAPGGQGILTKQSIAVADLDGDGRDDIAVAGNGNAKRGISLVGLGRWIAWPTIGPAAGIHANRDRGRGYQRRCPASIWS